VRTIVAIVVWGLLTTAALAAPVMDVTPATIDRLDGSSLEITASGLTGGELWLRLWIDAEQTWGRLIDQADPSRRIEVRYEDLVRDPDRALRPVSAFLGVDYEPGMLEIGATTTYERPDPSFAEQWRRTLTDAETRLVESRVGDLLASRGYEPSGLPHLQVSRRRRALLNVHDRIGRLRFRIDRFGPRLWLADLVARRFALSSLRVRTTRRMNEITAAHLK